MKTSALKLETIALKSRLTVAHKNIPPANKKPANRTKLTPEQMQLYKLFMEELRRQDQILHLRDLREKIVVSRYKINKLIDGIKTVATREDLYRLINRRGQAFLKKANSKEFSANVKEDKIHSILLSAEDRMKALKFEYELILTLNRWALPEYPKSVNHE